jgi:Zn-dependent protease with chaperone function
MPPDAMGWLNFAFSVSQVLNHMFFLSIVLHFSVACLMAVAANLLGVIPWRRAAAAHWTERARLLYPVRVTASVNIFLIPVIMSRFHLAPELWRWWISDATASFLGAVLGCYYLDHEMFPQLNVTRWVRHVIVGWGIRFFVFLPTIAALLLMPHDVNLTMLFVTTAYLAVHFANQGGMLIRFLRLVKILKSPGGRLKDIVNDVAARAKVPVRATWQLSDIMANAFAFPATRELAFRDRLLEICDDEEISAICAHEIAHIGEPNVVLAGRLIGSLYLLPLIFIAPLVHLFNTVGLIFIFLGMILIRRFSGWLSRRMEKRADRLASTGPINDGVYAGALEKMYRENQVPAVNASTYRSHPDLYDRMLRAGVKPDYPRPDRPKSITLVGWLYIFACIVAIVAYFRS